MRDWLKELDEIDRDCVHTYEKFLRRKLSGYDEYLRIEHQTDECPMEFENAKDFFETYPQLKVLKKQLEYNTSIYEDDNDIVIWFSVPREWAIKWFNENRKGIETNGNIAKDFYETLDDFNDDYIWEDTYDMYVAALNDGTMISIREK